MPNKVKHLRGTREQWQKNDPVIDEGEIALLLTESGRYRMKIGNGRDSFSALEMFGGEVYSGSGNTVLLKHCADVRFDKKASLTIAFPEIIDEDYYAMLTFVSPATPTTLTYPEGVISFSGTSLTEGKLVPEATLRYTLIFWYDGKMQCHVRSCVDA